MHSIRNTIIALLWLSMAGCQAAPADGQQNPAESSQSVSPQQELMVHALPQDSIIFRQTAEKFQDVISRNLSTAQLIIPIARQFLQTPYVASTLELEGEEQLVVNLREMDCTTFVEYVLAMAISLQHKNPDFSLFARNLACIRYRDGKLGGYPSRLHYFSEWIQNNADRGLITIVSNKISPIPYDSRVSFMTTNAHLYRQMANEVYADSMKRVEKRVSENQMHYIPKEQIANLEHLIEDGDIIAFTTNIEGLDVSHTGFAVHQQGRLYLLHASTRTHQVEITPTPLSEYLKPMRRVTGILVARPASTFPE